LDLANTQSDVWTPPDAQQIAESKPKNDFTFWLIFGFNPNLELSESLGERLIHKVDRWCCMDLKLMTDLQ